MDIGSILGVVGSAASGGVIGLIGTGISILAKQRDEKIKNAHEVEMRKLDQQEMQLEHDLKMKEITAEANKAIAVAQENTKATEATAQAEIEKADIGLRQASYAMDKATYGGGFVDAIRGLMRPVLTLYFAILMSIIAYQLMKLNNGSWVNPTEAQEMLRDVINAIIFLAMTSVTWWFGSRFSSKTNRLK